MKKFRIEFKWAIIFTVVSLLWMYFEKMVGWHDELIGKQAVYTNIFGILAIVIYVLALREKRDNYFNGIMDWKQGFISGAVLSVIIAAFTPLSQYLVHTFISPDFFKNIINFRLENSQLEQSFIENYYTLSTFIFQATFYALSYGIVTAGIVAWFVKKEPKNPDQTL